MAEEPSSPSSGFIVPRQVIPESPEIHEGHTNVSGTTLGHNDVESGQSQVADKIVAHLPFIQQQATLVMTLLVPPESSPDSLAAEARKLTEQNHPNCKRLKRSVEGLTDELEDSPLSSNGKSFLDISRARSLLPSQQLDAAVTNMYMINCTLLALNVFLPSMGTEPLSRVMQELDAQFPACVMKNFAENSSSRDTGASVTGEATFNLALNIRTQFFITELERRQQEHDFTPFVVLRQVFAMDLTRPDENDSQEPPSSFRGFNLPDVLQDEDGHFPENLPEKYLIAISDRFNDLQEELLEWDSVDIDGLKKAYRWRSFERDLARWIHTREKEIKEDLMRLSEKQLHNSPAIRRLTSVPAGTPSRRQLPAAPPAVEVHPRTPLVQSTESPQKQSMMNAEIVEDRSSETNVPRPRSSPQETTGQSTSDQSRQPITNDQPTTKDQPVTKDPGRRKSTTYVHLPLSLYLSSLLTFLHSNYRNRASLAALKRRAENSHIESPSADQSQAPNVSTDTRILAQASFSGLSADPTAAVPREIQQSPDLRYPDIGDDSTYVNNDEDLDLGQDPESGVMTSTSPPASARIERVSHNPRFFDSPRDADSQPSSMESTVAERNSRSTRRFIDKQKNAEVVSPISQLDPQSAAKHHPVLGKRARNDDSSSDETDNEFEENTHDIDPRRRAEKPQRDLPAAKRHRHEGHAVSDAGEGSQPNRTKLGNKSNERQSGPARVVSRVRTTESDGGTDEDVTVAQTEPPSSTQSRWATANAQAASSNHNYRKANYRWSEEEDERLIYLMGIWGTGFAAIKKQDGACPASDGGPKLERRSQINCKDRARNLKKKYIR